MALSKFGAAFKAARKAGKKEFSFGGKSYNTKLKGEGASKKVPTPSKRPDREGERAKARGQQGPGMKEASAQRAKDATMASRAAKRGQAGPAAAKQVGVAKAGSAISKAVAKKENAPKKREAQDYPRAAKAVGIARKGSPISKAAARRENMPKKK